MSHLLLLFLVVCMGKVVLDVLIVYFGREHQLSVSSSFLSFVHYELPLASKTPSTRFRWWQPLHSGEGYDQWAIDDVIILSEREKHIIPMANPTLPQVRNPSEEFFLELVFSCSELMQQLELPLGILLLCCNGICQPQ